MREQINEKVSVIMCFSAAKRTALPYVINWQNRDYKVGTIGYHHTVREGNTLHHIYELTDKEQNMHFRLNLDTSNLHWMLEVASDGNAY